MRASVLLSVIVLSTFISSNSQSKMKTILVVVAHPDDENMGGAALAKYARMGYRVQVIIATDGKDGTRVTKIPAGDSLGNLRKLESTCACEKLGIEPPIFFSVERLDTKIGVRNYLNARKKFISELKKQIESIQPDLLITFGPDGEYGHSEHIVVGAAVTELLLREGWVKKYPLYYLAWKKDQVTDNDDLGYVNDRYVEYEIEFSTEDEKKSIEASKCYVSQYTREEMEDEEALRLKDPMNIVPFRKFYVTKKRKVKADLFSN